MNYRKFEMKSARTKYFLTFYVGRPYFGIECNFFQRIFKYDKGYIDTLM